jgi:hypothetical protein
MHDLFGLCATEEQAAQQVVAFLQQNPHRVPLEGSPWKHTSSIPFSPTSPPSWCRTSGPCSRKGTAQQGLQPGSQLMLLPWPRAVGNGRRITSRSMAEAEGPGRSRERLPVQPWH